MSNFEYDKDPGFNKPEMNLTCAHPSFMKEIYMGNRTGDYECSECHEIFSPLQRRAILEKRDQENS